MAVELCIVCLKSNEDIFSRIHIASEEWQECNIQRIIEKHLWWWYLKNPTTDDTTSLQWICRQCWLELLTFHNFYLTVEKVHNQYFTMPTHYEIMEINETAAQLKTIKQESEAHNDTFPMEDLKPFYKKQRDNKQNEILEINETAALQKTIKQESEAHNETWSLEDIKPLYNEPRDSIQTDELNIIDIKNEVNLDKTVIDNEVDDANNISPITSTEIYTPEEKAKKCEELFKETGYKLGCSICQESIADFRTLKIHFNEKHNIRAFSMCCGKKFNERWKLMEHLNIHKNPELYTCQHCKKSFPRRYDLKVHLKTHDRRERKFNCEECGQSFLSGRNLATHMLVHNPKIKQELSDEACEKLFKETNYKLECSICRAPQSNFRLLPAHFRNDHYSNNPYAMCCGKKFIQRGLLIDHLQVHKNPKYFKCPTCKKTFTTRRMLETHLQSHGEAFQCWRCNKSFKLRDSFEAHLKTHETREEKFNCEECGKSFFNKCVFAAHMEEHDPEKCTRKQKHELSDEACEELFKETNYKLVCSICEVAQTDFRTLTGHFRNIHNNNNPYAMCCGKKFNQRCFLIDHLNVHKNPEYFKCETCKKTYTTRRILKTHLEFDRAREKNEELFKKAADACEEIFRKAGYKLECSICQVAQSDFRCLKEHFKNYHNNITTYAMCCGRKFTKRSYLINHLKVHKNPKYLKCQPCKKTFQTRSEFLQHFLRVHKAQSKTAKSIKNPTISAKACKAIFKKTQYKLECSICQEPQLDFRTLKLHFNKEHKMRAYAVCCGKRFSKQSFLMDHLNSHTNAKHFKCSHCNKVLASRRCLQNHVKVHEKSASKDLSKICNICEKSFRGASSFKRHMAEHANDNPINPSLKSEPIS